MLDEGGRRSAGGEKRRRYLRWGRIALTIAAGYALAGVPNVELVTLLVFVSGYLLGALRGAVVGAVAMGGHSLFNVMGAAIPPILVAQVACYAFIGLSGALAGPAILRPGRVAGVAIAGVCGATLVLLYQIIVNVVSFYTFTSESMLLTYLWGGIVFSSIPRKGSDPRNGASLRLRRSSR